MGLQQALDFGVYCHHQRLTLLEDTQILLGTGIQEQPNYCRMMASGCKHQRCVADIVTLVHVGTGLKQQPHG